MKKINFNDIDITNKYFWANFFCMSYPNAFDEESGVSLADIIEEAGLSNISWWNNFTGHYDGVFEENDGYLDEPTTIETAFKPEQILKIEFHPGDILYFINHQQIGSTGPHWNLQVLPFIEAEQLLEHKNGEILFFLLLPLTYIETEDQKRVKDMLQRELAKLFPIELCGKMTVCILYQILKTGWK